MPTTKLDEFTRAYIECMLWAETDNADAHEYVASKRITKIRIGTMTDITKFRNKKTGAIVEIKADFAQASSPISTRWNGDSEWHGTPYQVADARHPSPQRPAARR